MALDGALSLRHSDPALVEGEESRRGAKGEFLLLSLFEHVRPDRPVMRENLGELLKLYGFIRRALTFL